MSWTLKKRLDTFAGPGEIKRREVVLYPQVSPEEIRSREVELGCERLTLIFLFVCFKLLLNSGVTEIVLVTLPSTEVEIAIEQYTSCCAMARGHCLKIYIYRYINPLFWRCSTQSPRSSGSVRTVEPSLSRPLPLCPRP